MTRLRRIALVTAVVAVALGSGAYYLLGTSAPPEPALAGTLAALTLDAGGLSRSYRLYAPAQLSERPSLLIAFHGSTQDGATMRVHTGYGFDFAADAAGSLVAYPDGFEGHWNDCRTAAAYSARTRNIDDVAFVKALIARHIRDDNVDPSRVFAVGYSNGGSFVYRLALETPSLFAGLAAICACVPTDDNCDCATDPGSVPVMIVNGTADPVTPYHGGNVTLFGFGSRGRVRSSHDSASFLAARNGIDGDPAAEERGVATRTYWHAPGRAAVELWTVEGGGHVIHQPRFRPMRMLGKRKAIDVPEEVVAFFGRASRR